MSRRVHPARCDCLACFGSRLALEVLFIGIAALLLLSILLRPSGPPMSIEGAAKHDAAGMPKCLILLPPPPPNPLMPRRKADA